MQKLKQIFLAVLIGLIFVNPTLVLAQTPTAVGTPVNGINTPKYQGVDSSITQFLCTPSATPDGHDLERCVNKLYRFGIAFGAIALVFFLVFAGYMYISGGETGKTRAKGIVQNALVGIALLMGSYVILSFINPNLTIIKPIQPPIFNASDIPSCAEIGFGDDCVVATPGSDATIDLGQRILGGGSLVACGKKFSAADVGKNIVTVAIKVWDTSKATRNLSVQVNQCIADRVKKAFDQYYADAQKFPIHSVGGYRDTRVAGTSTLSAHAFGLAMDINAEENCHYGSKGGSAGGCYPPGTTYKPGSDPYAITTNSAIYKAMKANGLGWGGQWNSSKDYMHFSCTQNEQGVCN